jgi:hypothetical protein
MFSASVLRLLKKLLFFILSIRNIAFSMILAIQNRLQPIIQKNRLLCPCLFSYMQKKPTLDLLYKLTSLELTHCSRVSWKRDVALYDDCYSN